jgi:GntR family transcriptional regulator, transcriptional repressor for pyruvate dehydrogenase complex
MQLGVSRPTVREALKVLEALNVVESSTGPKGGTFVKSLGGEGVAEYLIESMSLLLDVDELTFEELSAAREIIEVPLAGMAAVRRTEQDLFVMQKTMEMDDLKDGDDIMSDISFHRGVAEASKNRILSLFVGSIHKTVRTLAGRYIMPEQTLPEVLRVSQEQHRLIYEAIMERDSVLASSRMREHLSLSYGVYREAIPKAVARGAWANASGNKP